MDLLIILEKEIEKLLLCVSNTCVLSRTRETILRLEQWSDTHSSVIKQTFTQEDFFLTFLLAEF